MHLHKGRRTKLALAANEKSIANGDAAARRGNSKGPGTMHARYRKLMSMSDNIRKLRVNFVGYPLGGAL